MFMTLDKSISEIKSIGISRNETITQRSRIAEIVEPALVAACEILYDQNIRTLESSANIADVENGYAGITIDYDTLSPENQRIADEYLGGRIVSGDNMGVASMCVTIRSRDVPCREISDLAVAEAKRFKFQPLTWAPIYTFSEVLQRFGYTEREGCEPEDFNRWYHYDAENQVFFASKEHYDKLKATPEVFAQMVSGVKSR